MKINDFFEDSRLFGLPLQIKRIMKLIIVIMTICLMQVTAATKAQITLNEKQASVQKVLKIIGKQSGYDFIYSVEDLRDTKPVSLKLENVSVERALQACFVNQPLVYEITDKTVVVRKQEEKSVIDRVKDFLAAINIGGRVFDEDGRPMAGVTVTVKGTTKAVVTWNEGHFFIRNVDENATLVFSYIGYISKEVKADSNMEAIILLPSTSKLDEVQVMAYGLTTRRLSTGNITTVKAADIEKQPVDNPIYALMGRVPGLIITPTSGMPGAPVKVQLRGQNSLAGNFTEPLFVIDGVPFSNNIPGANSKNGEANLSALSFINPADIESIDVLKDADATAIYGSRGANGVVLITTKKGKMGETRINFNAYSGYSEVSKKLDLLNTQQYLEMRKEAYLNDGLPLPDMPAPNNYDLTVWDQNRYTDWQEQLVGGTAKTYNAQISVSGGSATMQYRLSGTYYKQGSISPNKNKNENGTMHFSIAGNSPNGKFRTTLNGSYTGSKMVQADLTASAFTLAPNAPAVYNPDGSINWQPDPLTGVATWANPYAGLSNVATANTNTINSSADISYKISSSLQIKTTMGFSKVQLKSFTPNSLASQDPATYDFATGNSRFNNNSSNSFSVEPHAIYKLNIGKGKLDALFGASLQSQNVESNFIEGYGYTSDALLRSLTAAPFLSGDNTSSQYKYNAVFARLTYNLADKYVINLNARRDGSSRFGPGKQFGNFGSVAGAWIFSNEKFIQSALPFMSFGKLRFSYGNSGNDRIGDYQYLELYGNLLSVLYQGIKPITTQGAINPEYHWENTKKLEFALETGFFNDRLILSAAYFRTRSNDQLGGYPLPATGGNSTITINQPAEIQNMGGEFTLNSKNIKGRNFSWETSANLSIQRNKLLSLPDGWSSYLVALLAAQDVGDNPVGKPFSGIQYVNESRGVDPVTGVYQFADRDGLTTTDPALAYGYAKKITIAPQFFGGVSNSFTYKGLNLDVFVQFTKQTGKNYLYDGVFFTPGYFFGASSIANMPIDVLKRWKASGDIANVQRFNQDNSLNESFALQMNSDAAWVDASFIRVKNVSLSYNVADKWKQKLRLQNIRLYLQGQNLWTFTKYKGTDPETQSAGTLAPLRTLTAGINIGL